jgi:hypothetical protein
MKEIQLTQGMIALVDDEDFECLNKFKWVVYNKSNRNTCYAMRRHGTTSVLLHREILNILPGIDVDHKDGNGLNNQKSNLRICTTTQNQMNAMLRKDSTSGFKGVSWKKDRNKWAAQIQINKKRKCLGYFPTKEEAAVKYNQVASELYGEFARLNQI